MIYDPIEVMARNSFSNFHTKGLDYLCVHRSEELTIKVYFFERGGQTAPEVICPHDHRYPFHTQVLAGQSGHYRYSQHPVRRHMLPNDMTRYQKFDWRTPLLDGNGFEWIGEVDLERVAEERYETGQSYYCRADEIHTIAVNDDTVIMLYQFADTVPIDVPTSTFVPGFDKEPSSLGGLYEHMAEDRVIQLLSHLKELMKA